MSLGTLRKTLNRQLAAWVYLCFGPTPSIKPVPTIYSLGLPVRVANLLVGANITTVSELASLRVSDLRRIKGLGDVYLAEIERVMVERGLWR